MININSKWITSSFCASNSCVEVSFSADTVAVRDSKDRGQTALVYSLDEWRDFVAGVRNGEFDLE
jgi:hypothetical protein